MKKLSFVAAIATAGLMTSCAVSEHLTSNRNVMQTNVELSKNNFQVIGTAQGSATVTRVLGIGGLSLKAIRANACAEMVKNANLSGSQALINVNTEVKQRGIAPLYWKTVVTTCGQVIEFTSTEEQVSEHHAGTVKRFAPKIANTIAEEIIVVDPIAKIKSNTICYTADKDKTISVNIAKHPQFISNEYINGQGVFTFQSKITNIPNKAFFDCSKLDSIIIPESVTEIGDSVFARCHYLKMVYCQSTTPPTLGKNAFSNISREAKIYVPQNSVALYKSANGWKDYASKIVGYDFK